MAVEQNLKHAVLRELVDVRRRGYVGIDDLNKVEIATRCLEAAVKNIDGFHEGLTRVAKLKLLLAYEIPKLERPYCEWLDVLFGLKEGCDPTRPGELRLEAMRLAGETVSELFRRGKEAAALSALADQIIADCLRDYAYPPASEDSASTVEDAPAPTPNALPDAVPVTVAFSPPIASSSSATDRPHNDRWQLVISLTLLMLVGAVAGGVVAPRLYQSSLVWLGDFSGLSMIVARYYEWITTVVGAATISLVWLLLIRLWGRTVSPWVRPAIAGLIVTLFVLPTTTLVAVETAHQKEIGEAAQLRDELDNDKQWSQTVDDQFDRINNPSDWLAICTNEPVDLSLPHLASVGDLDGEWCDEAGGYLALKVVPGAYINAYDGRERLGVENEFYAETLIERPMLGSACGIGVAELADSPRPDQPTGYTQFVLEYMPNMDAPRPAVQFYDVSKRTFAVRQRAAKPIPLNLATKTYDNAPRKDWVRIGVLQRGDQLIFMVNDHAVLISALPESHSGRLRPAITASVFGRNPHGTIEDLAMCRYDYFTMWERYPQR